MKTVIIKTDGNRIIASGHIRRCLTIAEALNQLKVSVIFWFNDVESPLIFRQLCSDNDSFSYITKEPSGKADFLLLDSYSISESEFSYYREYAKKTGYIDDLHSCDPDVDIVINYDLDPPTNLYHAPIKLLGAEYAPLRAQFSLSAISIRQDANRIFISSGGTDPNHIIEKLLIQLNEHSSYYNVPELHCNVILGTVFEEKYKSDLRLLSTQYRFIDINESVEDIAALMSSCDLAITAGGTTLYELCALGIPTISFSIADNQLESTKSFCDQNAITYEGDSRNDPLLAQKLATKALSILCDTGYRQKLSQKAKSIVDGKGTERIATAILNCI